MKSYGFVILLTMFCLLSGAAVSDDFEGQWKIYPNYRWLIDGEQHGDTFWLASGGGLIRMDIKNGFMEWCTPVLEPNLVWQGAVNVDSDGAVWASLYTGMTGAGEVGIGRYRDGTWEVFSWGDGRDWVNMITHDREGVLWFGTKGGVLSWDGSNWRSYPVTAWSDTNEVYAVAVGPDDAKWFAVYEGLLRFKNGNWEYYPTERTGRDQSLAVDRDGVVWLGKEYLYRFDGDTWDWYPYRMRRHNWIGPGRYIAVNDSANVWWFVTADGIVSYDGEIWHTWTADEINAPADVANDLTHGACKGCFASGGTNWFFLDSGLVRFDGASWRNYPFPENVTVPPLGVNSLFVDSRDVLWASGFYLSPLTTYDNGIWRSMDTGGIDHSWINGIAEDQAGVLWFAARRGILSYDGAVWTQRFHDETVFPDSDFLDVCVGADNVKWFTLRSVGVLRVEDNSRWTMFTPENSNLPGAKVAHIAATAGGDIWCTIESSSVKPSVGGVCRFDGDKWTCFPELFTTADHIAVGRDDRLWVSVPEKGLYVYDGTGWNNLTRENSGLPTNSVRSLFIDSCNRIWIDQYGSEDGVFESGLYCFDGDVWHRFSWEYGQLPDDSVGQMAEDRAGSFWFGTTSALASFHPLFPNPVSGPAVMPSSFRLYPPYPNPFNAATRFRCELLEPGVVDIVIYSVLGQKVRTLSSGFRGAGSCTLMWDGATDGSSVASSGTYLYRAGMAGQTRSGKIMLVR